MLEDIYQFGDGDGEEDMEAATKKLSPMELRQQSVDQLIFMFKSVMIVVVFAYSAHQKHFREKNQNFNDNNKGLTKVIDSMISKIM